MASVACFCVYLISKPHTQHQISQDHWDKVCAASATANKAVIEHGTSLCLASTQLSVESSHSPFEPDNDRLPVQSHDWIIPK